MKRTKQTWIVLMVLVGYLMILPGCRGWRTERRPFHLNPNMDWQPKFKPQKLSLPVPEHTVAWGRRAVYAGNESRAEFLGEGARMTGKDATGRWVQRIPVPVNISLVKRGQQRFNIYCAVCHDKTGNGQGVVIQRGFVPPPKLSDARVKGMADGELFDVISHGVRNMPAYGKQVPVNDRWAIISYVRALQKMDQVSVRDVPEKYLTTLKKKR